MGKKNGLPKRLTVEEFTHLAIDRLAGVNKDTGKKWHGIHTVYSGFNQAFRIYFPGLDPVEETKRLVEKQVICLKLIKGGAFIWLREAEKDHSLNDPMNSVTTATFTRMGIGSQ